MTKKKGGASTPLFIILCAVLLLAVIAVGLSALSKMETYNYEASLTPTPSATPRLVSVTRDPAAPTVSPVATRLMFQNGATGESVRGIQQRLKDLGYLQGDADGQFGNATKAAVSAFQAQHNLEADGIVGEMTYAVLFSDEATTFVPTPTPPVVQVTGGALPILVNKDNMVDASFVPAGLVYLRQACDERIVKIKGSEIQGVSEAVDALNRMFSDAVAGGMDDWQISAGYRSIAYQQQLFNENVNTLVNGGASRSSAIATTRRTIADPGASEHHTGLAFDVTVPGKSFGSTPQCVWLHEHCWDYGFILRYQADKESITGISYEPWHIRYVGLPHSTQIRDNNLCLEEYIALQTAQGT